MEELKTEVRYEIRSAEYTQADGKLVVYKRGPYRTLGHAKQGLRYSRYMKSPRIVKITRTFTEVEEVVDL